MTRPSGQHFEAIASSFSMRLGWRVGGVGLGGPGWVGWAWVGLVGLGGPVWAWVGLGGPGWVGGWVGLGWLARSGEIETSLARVWTIACDAPLNPKKRSIKRDALAFPFCVGFAGGKWQTLWNNALGFPRIAGLQCLLFQCFSCTPCFLGNSAPGDAFGGLGIGTPGFCRGQLGNHPLTTKPPTGVKLNFFLSVPQRFVFFSGFLFVYGLNRRRQGRPSIASKDGCCHLCILAVRRICWTSTTV